MPIPRLGIGLAAVGRPAYITAGRDRDLGAHRGVGDLRARTAAVLDAAYDAGLRYVDVARSYGRAEEFLADWLAARPEVRDVVVGSKWGYRYVGNWALDVAVHEVKDHSLPAFEEQLGRSRALLGDRLSIYHVHSATLETGVLADAAVHRALARLKDDGVRVGISTSGPRQAEAVRAGLGVEVDGEPLFTSFQSTWNLLEQSVGPALGEAADAGALVIVKEALANGRLVGADSPAAGPATDLGVEPDHLALAAALAQPWAWRVLSGAVTPGQVRSNAGAETAQLPQGTVEKVVERLGSQAPSPGDYWSARASRPWA